MIYTVSVLVSICIYGIVKAFKNAPVQKEWAEIISEYNLNKIKNNILEQRKSQTIKDHSLQSIIG